jgi:hypothetical protein
MTEQKKIELLCRTCAWYREIRVPEKEQPADFVPRGYCYNQPPAVYPLPQPKRSTLALAQQPGQQEMDIVPLMLRPVVEHHEQMCGQFAPNKETRAQLEELQKQRKAAGCTPGSCGKEGCDCG